MAPVAASAQVDRLRPDSVVWDGALRAARAYGANVVLCVGISSDSGRTVQPLTPREMRWLAAFAPITEPASCPRQYTSMRTWVDTLGVHRDDPPPGYGNPTEVTIVDFRMDGAKDPRFQLVIDLGAIVHVSHCVFRSAPARYLDCPREDVKISVAGSPDAAPTVTSSPFVVTLVPHLASGRSDSALELVRSSVSGLATTDSTYRRFEGNAMYWSWQVGTKVMRPEARVAARAVLVLLDSLRPSTAKFMSGGLSTMIAEDVWSVASRSPTCESLEAVEAEVGRAQMDLPMTNHGESRWLTESMQHLAWVADSVAERQRRCREKRPDS